MCNNDTRTETQMKITKSQLKEIIREELSNMNEAKETGLYVTPKSNADKQKIEKFLDTSDYYGEWDREGYFFFPEKPSEYDSLEKELDKEFLKRKISARFEGI